MENVRIPDKAKVFLELSCNKLGSLPWEHGKIYKTSWVIFNGHYPALHYTVHVLPPHGSHVNEIDLKMVIKFRGNDGFLCPFTWWCGWLFLHAHVAIVAVNLAQFICGAKKHWLGCRKCFVYSQVAESEMGLMYLTSMWTTMPPVFLWIRIFLGDPYRDLLSSMEKYFNFT